MSFSRIVLIAVVCATAASCAPPDDEPPPELAEAPGFRKQIQFLESPCQIMVEGVGMVDIENDYIPGVVACENGGAPLEALKAQAVQARSFLYYKIFVAGQTTIRNSTSDQVYSCSYRPNGPDQIHRDAAAATKGQYLEWEGSVVASFYVAGAIPPNPQAGNPASCVGAGGNDPTSTERWVTYNSGKTGCDVDLTNLGFVPADCRGNPHNRGCASQNGEACLANIGMNYQDMLKYYYGDDIGLVVGEGMCGGDPPLSAEDQFCVDSGDGAHCFDADTVIMCAGGAAGSLEDCAEGCAAGACVQPPPPTFCSDKTDGLHCDGASVVDCVGGAIGMLEVCPSGVCEAGACAAAPEPGGNNGGANPDPGNNGVGGSGGTDPDGSAPGGTGGGFPGTVGTSPGIEGGCSVASGSDAAPGAVLLVGVLFGRCRRRRVRPVPTR